MPDYVILTKTTFRPVSEQRDDPAADTLVPAVTTWVPILGEDGAPAFFTADGEDDAVDSYAHDENGELVKPGAYRAVSKRNWGRSITLRPKTETDRSYGDD